MAGYDYNYRSGYSTGNGAGSYTNEWGKPRYDNAAYDNECRTVIVDADGTQRTIIGCTPYNKPGSYVPKSETFFHKRGHSPLFTNSYRHSSSPDYGYGADDQWRRPSSPPRQVVDDFSPRVQSTEAFRDNSRIAVPFNNGANWRQQPHQTGYNGTSGYGDYTDYGNNTSYKPSGHSSIRNDSYDDYNRKSGSHTGPFNMASNASGHRAKPGRLASTLGLAGAAGALPVRGDGRLSIPTDDMERALHYLKESSKTSSWPR